MKKISISFLVLLFTALEFSANAQTVIPSIPVQDNFGGLPLTDLNTFVPTTNDYTLEVQGTAGTPIHIAFAGITCTPSTTGTVRFVQYNGQVFVFENGNCAQLTPTPPAPQYTVSGSNLIQNPSFENGTLFDGSANRWIPDVWETWNGGSATWGTDVGYTNVREDANYRSNGTKSIIMHSRTRYLMQQLPANALEANAYYLLTYDYWTSTGSGNGGITYQILLGTDRTMGDIKSLRGHTTAETGTAQSSFSTLFQTPSTIPATVWFSLYRDVDKVDWLDNFNLVKIIPASTGITGATSALYLAGEAFAPENMTLTGGDYMDMTSRMANPGFENDLTGWTVTDGAKISTSEKADGLIAGTQKHAQIWVGSGGVTGRFYQSIANLPSGKYTVRVAVAPSFSGTVKLFANTGTTSITSGNNVWYEATGIVFDGTLETGLNLATSGSPTIDFDNFTLKYMGVDADAYLQVLNAKIAEAINDTVSIHNNTTAPGYNNLPQYRTALAAVTNLEDNNASTLIAAIRTITSAIDEYDAILAAYAPLKTAVNNLKTQLSASAYPDKSLFEDAIATAQAVYESPEDQRANIAATLASLAEKSAILATYKELGEAIAGANTMLNATGYAGKSAFETAIAAAQAVYDQPAGQDLAAALITLRKAKTAYYNSQYTLPAVQQTVSWVDTSLNGSEKFVLRVDGTPFYMTNIQVRLDKLYGYQGWGDAALEAVVKRAADDNFNTVSIPVFWREVEPEKNEFDWALLDKYLGWCKKYGLKMELLWFSWSSGGRVQYLWNYGGRQELRTPDYVCSMNGTSEFNILRTDWEYSLDWRDVNLRNRETYVLSQVMEHLAVWDANNGSPHTVVGVQLGNEARTHGANTATSAEIINYHHAIGSAVKDSKYKVWTRLNCVSYETKGRIDANESKRNSGGTNIDFVGIDIYGTSASSVKGSMNDQLPHTGKNYSMIMEIDAADSNTPLYQMAALAGNKAFDYYNMAVVDGNALYTGSGQTLVERSFINDVRVRNKILNRANQDIALKAHGNGLYVYNYAGSSTANETGLEGISFTPAAARTQAIAIRRSPSEIILLATDNGTFTVPASLGMKSASKGYFNAGNEWVNEGSVGISENKVTTNATTLVIRLSQQDITGIAEMQHDSPVHDPIVDAQYYNLVGARLTAPLQKGMYIVKQIRRSGEYESKIIIQ
jgi:hypothetical protein